MENETELKKIHVTPKIPGMNPTTLIAHFEAFGQIDSCFDTTHLNHLYETCVRYANVDSAKTAMLNPIHCIDGNNMTVRWKPHILDMNSNCLIEVFEYMDIGDLCRLNETCTKFKEIAEKVFILKYANEVKLKTNNDNYLIFVPLFDNNVEANEMLETFCHLIKSITLEHYVSFEPSAVDIRRITELIGDKLKDFSDVFFRNQSATPTETSSLKECTFVKNGSGSKRAARYRFYREPKSVTEIYFFNVTGETFIQKLNTNPNMNAVSICVNDSLPSETITQLCNYAPKIEYLALYQMGETNFDITALHGLKHLKVLNLSLCNATTDSLKSLLDLNVTIEGLLIRGAIIEDSFVSYLTKFKQLKVLVLTDDNLYDENCLVRIVAALPKLLTLIIDNKISTYGLKKIVKMCPSLTTFQVEDLQSTFKFDKLKKCFTTLKSLYLASPTTRDNVDVQRSQGHIHMAQTAPVFSYMFENYPQNRHGST